ncbi:MAG: hypothetical protein ACK53Y_18980, partial [bacterium]
PCHSTPLQQTYCLGYRPIKIPEMLDYIQLYTLAHVDQVNGVCSTWLSRHSCLKAYQRRRRLSQVLTASFSKKK